MSTRHLGSTSYSPWKKLCENKNEFPLWWSISRHFKGQGIHFAHCLYGLISLVPLIMEHEILSFQQAPGVPTITEQSSRKFCSSFTTFLSSLPMFSLPHVTKQALSSNWSGTAQAGPGTPGTALNPMLSFHKRGSKMFKWPGVWMTLVPFSVQQTTEFNC